MQQDVKPVQFSALLSIPAMECRVSEKKIMNSAKSFVLNHMPKGIQKKLSLLYHIKNSYKSFAKRECNICGYHGHFTAFAKPLRVDARCPDCMSLERHRLLMLAIDSGKIEQFNMDNMAVLHFAPEPILEELFRKKFQDYVTADLFAKADLVLNLEDIDIEDQKFDIIVANHVLEHVDDKKASSELSRILKPGGILVCQVPIVEGWATTYENASIISEEDRWLHFGQGDHVRYYGADFRTRISDGGFNLISEISADGEEVVKHGLMRGEKVFVFQKQ